MAGERPDLAGRVVKQLARFSPMIVVLSAATARLRAHGRRDGSSHAHRHALHHPHHDRRDQPPPPEAVTEARAGAAIKVPRIVEHSPRGRAWRVDLPPDDAADRRVAEFIARMVRPAGD